MKRLLRTFLFVSLGIAVVGVGHSGAALNPLDIVVVDFASGAGGSVIIVDPGTGAQTLLSTGGNFIDPFGIAVDPTGRIFVADGAAGLLIEVDNMTGAQNVVAAMNKPVSVAVGFGDDLWVADLGGGGSPAVYTVNKNSGLVSLVVAGAPLATPIGIAVNKFGTPYVVDRDAGGGSVFEIPSMTLISVGQNFLRPHGIAIDQGGPFFPANEPGGIYVTDLNSDAAIFVDVNLANNVNQTVQSVGQNFSFPSGISIGIGAWPTFLTPFYVADFGTKSVIEYDPAGDPTANQTVISAGGLFIGPARLAVAPELPVQVENKTWGGIKGQYR